MPFVLKGVTFFFIKGITCLVGTAVAVIQQTAVHFYLEYPAVWTQVVCALFESTGFHVIIVFIRYMHYLGVHLMDLTFIPELAE